MGNNTTCKTIRVGNIKLKIFDGKMQILTDSGEVPDLKNLISLAL